MTAILRRLDAWLGRTLFVPPIVSFCHATRQNQHEAAACFQIAAFFVLCWDVVREASFAWEYLFLPLFLFFIVSIYHHAFMLGRTSHPTPVLRYFAWFVLAANVGLWLLTAAHGTIDDLRNELFWTLVIAAEYALSIDNLPPRRKRDVRATRSQARSEA